MKRNEKKHTLLSLLKVVYFVSLCCLFVFVGDQCGSVPAHPGESQPDAVVTRTWGPVSPAGEVVWNTIQRGGCVFVFLCVFICLFTVTKQLLPTMQRSSEYFPLVWGYSVWSKPETEMPAFIFVSLMANKSVETAFKCFKKCKKKLYFNFVAVKS